jgi:hypothetical protein
VSDFNRGRVSSSAGVYDIPYAPKRLRQVLGGWQLAALVHGYDGRPLTIRQTGTTQSGEPVRPDRISVGSLPVRSVEGWFDVSAFRRVALNEYRFGNSGRNILAGPGKFIMDAAVSRTFAIKERGALAFRTEFFNLMNRANFGDPGTAIDQPTAGIISSSDPGRQIQFALRYSF